MLALFAAALGGCVGSGGPVPAKAGPPRAPASSAPSPVPRGSIVVAPQVMSPLGLSGVIGSSAGALTRRFGAPRLDLAEGDARKLQFAGPACVLDVFLYPLGAGSQPTATHVEARLRRGGASVDPGACIREVEKR